MKWIKVIKKVLKKVKYSGKEKIFENIKNLRGARKIKLKILDESVRKVLNDGNAMMWLTSELRWRVKWRNMAEFVQPGIRKVLKSFHQRAPSSLKGPGLALIHPHKKELESPDDDRHSLPSPMPMAPPPPVLPVPILSTADPSCGDLLSTELEGKEIGCFLLGGETRLCLPQVLNHVLKDFSFEEINRVIEYLGIDCSQCTPEQLQEFKMAGILPEDVKSCGLITRTNAERLCSLLLHESEMKRSTQGMISFKVYHRCFDRCEAICTPDLYSFKEPACIQCIQCNGWFSPQRFVCHAHKKPETHTCHWGFNSGNWRAYVHVELTDENREENEKLLDKLRDRELQEMEFYEARYREQREREILKRKVGSWTQILSQIGSFYKRLSVQKVPKHSGFPTQLFWPKSVKSYVSYKPSKFEKSADLLEYFFVVKTIIFKLPFFSKFLFH